MGHNCKLVIFLGEGIQLPVIRDYGKTDRIDNWWLQPFLMGLGLTIGMAWAFLRVLYFDGDISYDDHRVTSPIFSPDVVHIFNFQPAPWVNSAMLILWIPFGFRGTCYYMRRVYFRTFFASPAGCVVSEPAINKKLGYAGEKRLFIFNNLHRYMLLLAMMILLVKWYDVFHSMQYSTGGVGLSLGTILLAIESYLLTMYVTSCHSFRHFVGGILDRWDKGSSVLRGKLFNRVTGYNRSHGFWFWLSLAFVYVGDLWVMLVSSGKISDIVFFIVGGA